MKEAVRDRYARHAVELPQTEVPPTLGLGDPVTLAKLQADETVLDLGSGPGRDLLEAARLVGPAGRAIGVDFTPEMIERAQRSAADAGLGNVAILNGELEGLPLHCGAVDVVISNCVINLVDDKRAALVEAYRALRPGGRLAILDTAFEDEPGAQVRESNDAWCACVGGSLTVADYATLLADIGYGDVNIEIIGEFGDAAKSVAVTATKPGDATPTLRPAVTADRDAIEGLLEAADLPTDGFKIEDAIVALDDRNIVGAIALERFGTAALLRSLVVAEDARHQGIGRKLVIAALEVARWAKIAEVHLLTEDAQRFFTPFGFEAVSGSLVKDACAESALVSGQCCTTATAMRLSFEQADLPLLSKPSIKPLPTFQDGACC